MQELHHKSDKWRWSFADTLFKKYDAHVTFFVVREITGEKAEVMKKLQDAGHTLGLHSQHHSKAVSFIQEHGERKYIEEEIKPQLEVCRKVRQLFYGHFLS